MTNSTPPPDREADRADDSSLESVSIASAPSPNELRKTPATAIATTLARRPLWQVVIGLGGGAIGLTLLAIALLTVSGLALRTLERAIVTTLAGATVLALFAAVPTGAIVYARRSIAQALPHGATQNRLRLAMAIAVAGGVAIGIVLRLLLAPPV